MQLSLIYVSLTKYSSDHKMFGTKVVVTKMKHTFCAEQTLPVSVIVLEILKQEDTSAPELLRYAYIS
jgi:hypothetical protein